MVGKWNKERSVWDELSFAFKYGSILLMWDSRLARIVRKFLR